MKEALYYLALEEKNVRCVLCPHECLIFPGKTGLCRARKNIDGKLFSLTYNQFTSINLDPIEKKPLNNFYPGTKILSVGTTGCNFKCSFCQNWEISQAESGSVPVREFTKEMALQLAKKNGSIGIAYTYNEPLINYEWVAETAVYFRKNEMKNVLVSNGYINQKPLLDLVDYIDAANVDVKSFSAEFYKSMCSGRLDIVLENIKTMVEHGVHVEITNLIIPEKNDSIKEIGQLVDWIASINSEIPLHFSRYFPQYKAEEPMTPKETLLRAFDAAKSKLKYVYLGNV